MLGGKCPVGPRFGFRLVEREEISGHGGGVSGVFPLLQPRHRPDRRPPSGVEAMCGTQGTIAEDETQMG